MLSKGYSKVTKVGLSELLRLLKLLWLENLRRKKMDIKCIPVLCGGTFFTLLLEAGKQGLNERKKFGESAEFTERDVFEALIKVAVPTYEKPIDSENFKSVVSAYKSCNTSKSGRLPIHEQANMATFSNRIKNDYQKSLSAMTLLIENYIDIDGKGDWLARALVELVCMDETIKETDPLYVLQDGQPLLKNKFNSLVDICLPALLLGIWHFVIANKTDNIVGKITYEDWCKPGKSKNTREPFKSNIGEGITRQLNIFMPIEWEPKDATIDEEPYIDFTESYTEEATSNPSPNTTTQIINSPAVFFNSGANAIQINNTGVLNIDRGGKI